jgi:hypothetical protein
MPGGILAVFGCCYSIVKQGVQGDAVLLPGSAGLRPQVSPALLPLLALATSEA